MYDIKTVNDIMIVTFRYEHYATDVAGCTYLWDNTIWRSLLSGWLYSIRGGSRHGCGMRLTPHPPLAPKPFDHGLNEWIALSMGWWAQPPPPPLPSQWDPGTATEYIWKVLHIYCHWICSVTHTEQLRELHGVWSIQTTVTAFLYVKCYTHGFPQLALALN